MYASFRRRARYHPSALEVGGGLGMGDNDGYCISAIAAIEDHANTNIHTLYVYSSLTNNSVL